jgi:hypothetical protein
MLQILKDFDSIYKKGKSFAISLAIGWFCGGMVSLILFLAIFFGWRPFKKYDHEQHGNYTPWSPPNSEIYQDGKRTP